MLSEIEIAKELLKINAIKLQPDDPFTWASGLRSPIYCDNRLTLSYPQLRTSIKRSLSEKAIEAWTFNKVAGVATAGIAHGALVADHLNLPFVYVRSKPKGHGARNQIEGDLLPGDRCLVVEDLISTGGSCIKAIEVLRENGAEIAGAIAIFTYEFQKAKDNFNSIDCPFTTLSNYSSLLIAAKQLNKLNETQFQSLTSWRKNPQKWSKQFC